MTSRAAAGSVSASGFQITPAGSPPARRLGTGAVDVAVMAPEDGGAREALARRHSMTTDFTSHC